MGPTARASSLLEFVAAVVAAGSAASQGGPPELAVELGAVGEAARWTNAALLEALAAVDRGLAAIADECAACAPRAPSTSGEGSAAAAATSEGGGAAAEEADEVNGGASEAGFARKLGTFLAGAQVQRGELVALADACRADFQALASYLGEPPATAAPEVRPRSRRKRLERARTRPQHERPVHRCLLAEVMMTCPDQSKCPVFAAGRQLAPCQCAVPGGTADVARLWLSLQEVLGTLWAFAVQFDKAARELHPPAHK